MLLRLIIILIIRAQFSKFTLKRRDAIFHSVEGSLDDAAVWFHRRCCFLREFKNDSYGLAEGRRGAAWRRLNRTRSLVRPLSSADLIQPKTEKDLVQRVLVTADLPSWDLQLRSDPPSYALGATDRQIKVGGF